MGADIGFVGLGNMGLPMATNLVDAGYEVVGYDVDEARCREFERDGGRAGMDAEATTDADVVITMVRTPDQIRAVTEHLHGPMRADAIHVDMSTVGPVATEEIVRSATDAGVRFVDAPVSGGVQGAERGTLAIMVGGDEDAVGTVQPIFDILGEDIVHMGESGTGQMTKLCLQVLVGAEIVSISEAFAMGAEMDLDLEKLYDVLTSSIGTSGMLEAKGHRLIDNDFEPTANIDLQHKDMQLVMDVSEQFELPLHATAAVTQIFLYAKRAGLGDLDQMGVYELLDPESSSPNG